MRIFPWLNRFRVQQRFPDGSLIRPHRDFNAFEYVEKDGRAITVEAYVPGIGPAERALVRSTLRAWTTPDKGALVDPETEAAILRKFEAYFTARGIRYVVE